MVGQALLQFVLPSVFFDADAIIAGSASQQGAAFILLQLSELGLLKGYSCEKAIVECRKNLQVKLPDALSVFEKIIPRAITILPDPTDSEIIPYAKMAHEKDLPILTAALGVKAHFLVTFNMKDFNPAPGLGLKVLKPGDLLRRIHAIFSTLSAE